MVVILLYVINMVHFIFIDVGIARIKLDYQYLLNREAIHLRHVME